jgi:undecaprenyl diphosphate synthase
LADTETPNADTAGAAWARADATARRARAVPRHIAIIMDGNGRWAKARSLPRAMGHRKGVDAVRRTVQAAMEIGVDYLTIYSFSSENWSRPTDEIDDLMGLIKLFIRRDLAELHRNGVVVRVIGERTTLEPEMLALIEEAERLTAANTALTLVVAFNYGARAEITNAARRLAARVAAGEIAVGDITEGTLADCLETNGIPDPDLLIRTSGELRLSNFLLWQAAYTEFVFIDNYWPEFGRELLEQAIGEYHARDRRYGGLSQRSSA